MKKQTFFDRYAGFIGLLIIGTIFTVAGIVNNEWVGCVVGGVAFLAALLTFKNDTN